MNPPKAKLARPVRPVRRRRSRVVTGLVVFVMIVVAIAVVEIGALSWSSSDPPNKAGPAATVSVGTPIDPAFFAPGACLVYPPTAGDRHETVFLDAGHGGIDPGGVGTTTDGQTIYEADETLPVELDAMTLLRAKGYRVVVSRTEASTVLRLGPADTDAGVLSVLGAHDDVAARDVCANDSGANILVGIYFDAGVSSENAGSITAYDADRPFSAANIKLAGLLQADVLADMDAQGGTSRMTGRCRIRVSAPLPVIRRTGGSPRPLPLTTICS